MAQSVYNLLWIHNRWFTNGTLYTIYAKFCTKLVLILEYYKSEGIRNGIRAGEKGEFKREMQQAVQLHQNFETDAYSVWTRINIKNKE